MRLLVSGTGSTAKYKDVRGPDGTAFAKWRESWPARMAERFGLAIIDEKRSVTVFGGLPAADRRRLRNARKQERRARR